MSTNRLDRAVDIAAFLVVLGLILFMTYAIVR